MEDSFYIDLENKFRGSRALIKDRLTVYLPIIKALYAVWPNGRAVDFGCGRGEWLELLGEHGWQREGIDSNRAMVEYCKSVNLPCNLGDAIEFLKTAKSECFALITGFHIAEHLGFDVLREFLKQAHRVLAPGGILILETPNPENLMVRACNFYVDPTHQRPLPPVLMQFLIEHAGFSRSTIMRLNGPKVPTKESDMAEHLSWAIGAYPDYSVVAQGKPTPETADIFKHIDDQAERYEDAFSSLSKTLQLKQAEWEVQLQASQQEALRLSQALAEREQALSELQVRTSWLQNEWDAAKQRVEEFSQRTGRLEGELDFERQRTVQLGAELQAAREYESLLSAHNQRLQDETMRLGAELRAAWEHEIRLQAHAQWLQNEWDAAKAKIDELNQSSRHWWSVADGLNRELQRICASYSWRITWPVRKTLMAAKQVAPFLKRAVCLMLHRPQPLSELSENSIATASPLNTPEESIKNLSPRSNRIYADLKKAIETRKH